MSPVLPATFDCETCRKCFSYSSQLRDHYKNLKKCKPKSSNKKLPGNIILNITNANLFSCNQCPYYTTRQAQHLTRHKKRDCPNKESNVIKDGFECELCGCFLKSRVKSRIHDEVFEMS